MRVKEGDETKETAMEKEGDGTVERSVFEEASDMPRGAKGSGNGKGKFSRGKWANQQNIVKLLVSLVGLGGGSILATANSYMKTSLLQSEKPQRALQTHTKASPRTTTTFPGKMLWNTYKQ